MFHRAMPLDCRLYWFFLSWTLPSHWSDDDRKSYWLHRGAGFTALEACRRIEEGIEAAKTLDTMYKGIRSQSSPPRR